MESTPIRGVILQLQPYAERAWIASLWTEELGRIGLYAPEASLRSGGGPAVLTPPNEVEALVDRRHTGLWRCREVRLASGHDLLRTDFDRLRAASTLLHAVIHSQMDEKPAPLLYHLFLDYLRRLESGAPPQLLTASFYLKTLRHEGLWTDTPHCSTCGEPLPPLYIAGNAPACFHHAPPDTPMIDVSTWKNLLTLAYCHTTADFNSILETTSLLQTATDLFRMYLD